MMPHMAIDTPSSFFPDIGSPKNMQPPDRISTVLTCPEERAVAGGAKWRKREDEEGS